MNFSAEAPGRYERPDSPFVPVPPSVDKELELLAALDDEEIERRRVERRAKNLLRTASRLPDAYLTDEELRERAEQRRFAATSAAYVEACLPRFFAGAAAIRRDDRRTIGLRATEVLAVARDGEADRLGLPREIRRLREMIRREAACPPSSSDLDEATRALDTAESRLGEAIEIAHGEVRWRFAGAAALVPKSALRAFAAGEPRTMAGLAATGRQREALASASRSCEATR